MASAEREEVIEHARAHPEESGQAIAKRFGLNRRTANRWLKAAGLSRPPKRPPNGTKNGTPEAEDGTKAAEAKPKAKRKARAKGDVDGTRAPEVKGGPKGKGDEGAQVEQVQATPPQARKARKARTARAGGKHPRPEIDASTLHPDERARLIRIIHGCREITEASVHAFLARLDAWRMRQPAYLEIEDPAEQAAAMKADPIPAMDARQAQVNLNHQKMIESMLGTYTGLEELANADKSDEPEEKANRSERVAAALGLGEDA